MKRFNARQTYPLFILILSVFFITGCGGGGGAGETGHWLPSNPTDTTAPSVTAVSPLANATGVATNTKIITAAFSKAMDPATLTSASFTLECPAGTPTAGSVTYLDAGNVATLRLPATPNLPTNTSCTATVTTAAKDLAGNALASNFVWRFTTGATPDTSRPRVTLTVPATTTPGPTPGVATNTAITAVFNEEMDPATLISPATSFTLTCPLCASAPAGSVGYAVGSKMATFTPSAVLEAGKTYTATIKGTGASPATDLATNALAGNPALPATANDYVWTFTTATPAPAANVTVSSSNPAAGAPAVCSNSSINATFTVPSGLRMDPATITTLTFTVTGPGATAVTAASVLLDGATGRIATFTPASSLTPGVLYTATIKSGAAGVKDLAIPANAMVSDYTWTFTAGPATAACPEPVALGRAAPFGTMGDVTGATNTGTSTVITGDFSSTATATANVTGFHDSAVPVPDIYTETGANTGLVTGTIYTCTVSTTGPTSGGVNAASCTIATNALADAQTAYNTLAGLAGGTDPSGAGGELGGLTLTPGTYKSATSFMVGSGDLTLDGQGNANAVWVFQMGSTLTIGDTVTPRSIILINGAQAKNVFWQVGSSATINGIVGGGTIEGTILAAVKVTVSTVGVASVTTINGRALGLTAQTVINNTVINVPAP